MTQLKLSELYHPHRRLSKLGRWLPASQLQINQWIHTHLSSARSNPPPRSQPVKDLETVIYSSPEIYMLFSLMLSEVPLSEDPVHRPEITTIPDLLLALDQVLISAPSWSDPDTANILAAPINTILNWPMATKAGFAAFLNADINEHLQRILTHWAHFLSTPESCVSLTPDCWFSPAARSMPGMRNFQEPTSVIPPPHIWASEAGMTFSRVVCGQGRALSLSLSQPPILQKPPTLSSMRASLYPLHYSAPSRFTIASGSRNNRIPWRICSMMKVLLGNSKVGRCIKPS